MINVQIEHKYQLIYKFCILLTTSEKGFRFSQIFSASSYVGEVHANAFAMRLKRIYSKMLISIIAQFFGRYFFMKMQIN